MNRKPRKVAVFTGSRAVFGLLRWIMEEIRASHSLELQTIVSGTHLSPQHGETWKEIAAEGFEISESIPMLISANGDVATTKSMALALMGLAESFERLQPDVLVILGDRYETFAAAQAAMLARIPIAHIHGGEKTEGAIDEAIRHSISKMSHFHFVAAENFKDRIIQLGEDPNSIWVVGASGLDNIERVRRLSKKQLEKNLGFRLKSPTVAFTYHPVTLEKKSSGAEVKRVLDTLLEYTETIVITGVNADPGANEIRDVISGYLNTNQERVYFVENLGTKRYLSLLAHSDVVVGNSSSGILEAPSLGTPTVDIGDRQKGRPTGPSILHCSPNKVSIQTALKKALGREHQKISARKESPYGTPGAAKRICEVLEHVDLSGVLKKSFYDL